MAKVKISGDNLTKHFTFSDYGKNQTGTIPIGSSALLHAQCLEEFREWLGIERSAITKRSEEALRPAT